VATKILKKNSISQVLCRRKMTELTIIKW